MLFTDHNILNCPFPLRHLSQQFYVCDCVQWMVWWHLSRVTCSCPNKYTIPQHVHTFCHFPVSLHIVAHQTTVLKLSY